MGNESGITKQDLVDALKEVGFKPGSGGNSAGGGGGGNSGSGFKQADEAASSVGKKLKDEFGNQLSSAGRGLSDLKNVADNNINTWQDLSNKGANFGNNVVGMNVAAAGSRVSLSEFADTISNNNKALISLGTNSAQGSKKFAQMTDEMYTNMAPVTDQLRQQGFSNKELNDILAIQVGFNKTGMRDEPAAREAAIKGALDMAQEMEKVAQMTGKSRKEQEEAMKKASADTTVQMKFREILLTQGAEAAQKAENAYKMGLIQAQATGQEQAFKENFAFGNVITKEAANQQAMLKQQGTENAAAARAAAAGNIDDMKKHQQNVQAEQIKNNNDLSIIQAAKYGSVMKGAGDAARSGIEAGMSMFTAEKNLRQEAAFKNASADEVAAELRRRAELAAAGKNEKGQSELGAATTKAAINVEQRMKDAGDAIAKQLVTPLNDKAGPTINKFADTAAGATQKLSDGKVVTTPQAMNKAVEQGYKGTGSTSDAKPTGLVNQALNTAGTVGAAGESVAKGVGKVLGFAEEARSSKPPEQAVQKADGGLVPGTDKGTTVTVGEKGKPEAIVPLDQLKNMMAGGASPVGGMTSNEQLKARAEEAIRVIQEHGQGSFDTQIRISESGNIRIREQFDAYGNRMQSLGDTSSRERIAELIKQAGDLKAADQKTAENRIKEIAETAKVEAKAKTENDQKIAQDRLKNVVETAKVEAKAKTDADQTNVEDRLKSVAETAKVTGVVSIEDAKAKAKAMAEAYGGRSEGGVETVKPKQSINDMMGDMLDKMAGGIDVKSITKDIKGGSTDPKVQAEIEKAEKDKRYIAENKAKEEKEKNNKQATVQKVEHKATLDDVVAALMKLNSTMHQVADHSEGIKRATKNMSGNSLTRG